MELILEGQTLGLGLVGVLIGRGLDVVFDTVNFLINLMVFFEEASEVVIAGLEIVDGVVVLGKFAEEVVFFDRHDF